MSKANQTFFIPESIRRLRLSELPLSRELASVLRRLRISTFEDLTGASLRDFQRVSDSGTALFLEIDQLIQRARHGDFAVPTLQQPSLNRLSGPSGVARAPVPGANTARVGQTKPVADRLVAEPKLPLEDAIFIPQEARGQPLSAYSVSARLEHIFGWKNLRLAGDLHGLTFSEVSKFRNCGKKTLDELRELVRAVQRACPGWQSVVARSQENQPYCPVVAGCLVIPTNGRSLKPSDLPISARLEGVLEQRGISRLADLEGTSITELRATKNCGRKTIHELLSLLERAEAGEFSVSQQALERLSVSELPGLIDSLLKKLPPRNGEWLLLRFGSAGRIHTLEEVGEKFGVTRERVRQAVEREINFIHKAGGARLKCLLQKVANDCFHLVCPLTPELFNQWIQKASNAPRYSLTFYVRLSCNLNPQIPAWPRGQEPASRQSKRAEKVIRAVEDILREAGTVTTLSRAFQVTLQRTGLRDLTAKEFLSALRHARSVVVQFPQADQPIVRLRHLRVIDVAKTILDASHCALIPEEIISEAQTKFGRELADWSPQTIGNALTPERGFYLLGPRAYGLRRHFRLPGLEWRNARADAHRLLKQENRPVSTSEIVNEQKFSWTNQTNAYELAQILREDKRFTDLGKFLFALDEWGMEEREYVKDLVPRIFAQQNSLLTANQILEHLRKLRSFSPYAITGLLRKIPSVRDYGFGYYGLHSWGDSIKESIVADGALIERVIRRSDPPVSFARLCEILEIPGNGALAEKLWQTCALLRSVVRQPDERASATLLLHKKCTLERALVATARAVNRPLPLYEFQWELNERFGPLFATKSLDELRRCLEQSAMFLRDVADEFILDIHLDQLGLEADAIRRACAEILLESNEIVGCEDLLERLEADSKSWAERSPSILGFTPFRRARPLRQSRRCLDRPRLSTPSLASRCSSRNHPVVWRLQS